MEPGRPIGEVAALSEYGGNDLTSSVTDALGPEGRPGAWPDALVSRTAIRPIRGCRGTGASRSRPTYRPACTATANFDGSGTVTPSESGMTSAGIVCG
ncbi:hypothetical protein ACFQ0T_39415 [Kitasatospora gansuensis]